MEIKAIKEMIKTLTDTDLVDLEINARLAIKHPHAYGNEIHHRRMLRQLIKEQISRKLQAWTKVEA